MYIVYAGKPHTITIFEHSFSLASVRSLRYTSVMT